ncbi:cytochrome c-type biogenesis protein [Rhodospirillaceae bacterium SYSU D60014]|uniref:cytochrome c-type biogenesis protein n=1 Tax=Virgifigura deserti TaxID=2268457 RepID=UPI000E66073F
MRRGPGLLSGVLLALLLGLAASTAGAVQPDEILDDPTLEARARTISQDIRCLVCQNQSIDDSDADLARDLRLIVRERLVAGDSDAEIKQFLVARYGDYVLLEPPVKPSTYVLWFGPAAILLVAAGGIGLFFHRRRARSAAPPPLTAEERQRLATLLDDR